MQRDLTTFETMLNNFKNTKREKRKDSFWIEWIYNKRSIIKIVKI